jgi:hypothetical protein
MHQVPQPTRPARSDLAAATTRAQQVLHSMRAQFGQSRFDEELASGGPPQSNPLLRERPAPHAAQRPVHFRAVGSAVDP